MKNLIGNIFIYILLMQWIRKMCKIERLIFLFFFFFYHLRQIAFQRDTRYKLSILFPMFIANVRSRRNLPREIQSKLTHVIYLYTACFILPFRRNWRICIPTRVPIIEKSKIAIRRESSVLCKNTPTTNEYRDSDYQLGIALIFSPLLFK